MWTKANEKTAQLHHIEAAATQTLGVQNVHEPSLCFYNDVYMDCIGGALVICTIPGTEGLPHLKSYTIV